MTPEEELQLEIRLYAMSEQEFLEFQERLMDVIIEKKMSANQIVFSGVEDGLLN